MFINNANCLNFIFLSAASEIKGTEFIASWRQFVCSGLFTPCHWGEIQRLRKCQVILNRIVSPIYREFLTKISRPGVRSGRCWRISNTQTDVTLWCHVTFWPRHSNAIFEGKIAQLWALVKSTIFIVGNSNFEIVNFKRYIFILCGKNFASQAFKISHATNIINALSHL